MEKRDQEIKSGEIWAQIPLKTICHEHIYVIKIAMIYATTEMFGVSKIKKKKEINTFTQQRLKLMKSDSKDIYITKYFYFK